jgi:hypothetical protein
VLARPLPDRRQAQKLAPAPKVASFGRGLLPRTLAPSLIRGVGRSRPIALGCRSPDSRSSPVKLKIVVHSPEIVLPCGSFHVVPSMCFLRRVSTGHQGGVSMTGGGCQADVGRGVSTAPGPGQRNRSRTPGPSSCAVLNGLAKSSRKGGRPTRVRRARMVHANRPTDGVYAT